VVAGFETPFTALVGCRVPIQLAVMGGGTGTPELAAAVSEAGGLGMISSTFPLPVTEQLSWVRARTTNPLGVGFFAFDLPRKTNELELAASTARVLDVFWGDPDPVVVDASTPAARWRSGRSAPATRRCGPPTPDATSWWPKAWKRAGISVARRRCSGCSLRSFLPLRFPSSLPAASPPERPWRPP
jgi:hypothetical protein